jgi:toxin-antitoxin system PIN domain toxin
VIIPDVNLLVYAYDSRSPAHHKAVLWWQECLSGTETIGLPLVVLFGFVRVVTNPRIFQEPYRIQEAGAHVREWLAQPHAQLLAMDASHLDQALKFLEMVGIGGNLVTDAQIAALAIEYEAIVHTADADFIRFPALRWLNPITGMKRPITNR